MDLLENKTKGRSFQIGSLWLLSHGWVGRILLKLGLMNPCRLIPRQLRFRWILSFLNLLRKQKANLSSCLNVFCMSHGRTNTYNLPLGYTPFHSLAKKKRAFGAPE